MTRRCLDVEQISVLSNRPGGARIGDQNPGLETLKHGGW